jgi:hypothetical protein
VINIKKLFKKDSGVGDGGVAVLDKLQEISAPEPKVFEPWDRRQKLTHLAAIIREKFAHSNFSLPSYCGDVPHIAALFGEVSKDPEFVGRGLTKEGARNLESLGKFFELNSHQLHYITCYCAYGVDEVVSGEYVAQHVEAAI